MVKKIGDVTPRKMCMHPEHNPPGMIVLPNGIYEHICPGCKHKTVFTINRPIYTTHPGWRLDGPGPEVSYALG